jgi:hypothetical protein
LAAVVETLEAHVDATERTVEEPVVAAVTEVTEVMVAEGVTEATEATVGIS